MNTSVIVVAVLVVVLLGVWLWLRSRQIKGAGTDSSDRLDTLAAWPPRSTRVLTSQERLAYSTLVRAFPDHLVLAQVPLSRFLRVPTRYSHAEWLRRVGQLCADLVVCDTATQPLAVVIVEAPGGATSERARQRQQRMMRVLKAAEVRCFVWIENAMPTVEMARASVLGARTEAEVAASASPARPDSERHTALDEGEPPPTWYDDISTGPVPLAPTGPKESERR
jgi:hypothetical protein